MQRQEQEQEQIRRSFASLWMTAKNELRQGQQQLWGSFPFAMLEGS